MRAVSFSPERALESLLFLSTRLQEPTIHEVLKLRYFADKLHMQAHGFAASGDSYCALEFGPVGSETYNVLKAARGERSPWINGGYSTLVADAIRVDNRIFVIPLRKADESKLSKADLACLEKAIELYGNMPFDKRTDISHDDAWRKAWVKATDRGAEKEDIPLTDIAGTLENSEQVLEYMSA